MESLWMIDRQKVIETISEGKEIAIQLQALLQQPCTTDDGCHVFVAKILQSFTNTLSILKNSGETSDVCQSPMSNQVGSPCSDDRKSENSVQKRKALPVKDRRGGYRRRKGIETWTKITPSPIDDGFSWRKYGQKEILNAKFPRNYFRCTHKNDQGCLAAKQVQKTDDDPPTYRTIYMGNHTCQKSLRAPNIILDSPLNSSYVLNFQSNTTTASHGHHHILSPFPSSIKRESQEELAAANQHEHASSSSEYLLQHSLSPFNTSGPTSMFDSNSGSDHGDVISSLDSYRSSYQNLENFEDFLTVAVNFDDVFHFDDDLEISF